MLLPLRFMELDQVERGQAIYRLWIGPFILSVVALLDFLDVLQVERLAFYCIAAYCLLGVGWIYVISMVRMPANVRRVLIIFLDLGVYSIGLSLAAEIYGLLLWVPLSISMGNGLRYSAKFGLLSAVVSGVCVTIALLSSPFWRSLPLVSIGVVLTITIIPFYAFLLTKKITQHKQGMERRTAELEAAIKVDCLTGALNQRGINIELALAFELSKTTKQICAVMVVDLDGFKRINDEAEHAAGNEILKQVVQCMHRCVRISDSVGRIGGDEFAIALRALQLEVDASRIGDSVVEAVAALRVPGHPALTVGASIGVCLLSGPSIASVDDALEAADRGMYRAKKAGKGRCVMN
jgi:diguanylate cyclase (GGDEF)-like protein